MTLIKSRLALPFLVLAIAGLSVSFPAVGWAEAPLAAPVAPNWKLADLDGHAVGSEQLKGKVVILDFWATWCGPCVGEIAGYIELQKKHAAEGLVIVGVSVDQAGPEVVRKFVKAKGINYVVAMADDAVTDAFGGMDAIPTTFLIDRAGRIINRKVGAMPHEEYAKLVEQALR